MQGLFTREPKERRATQIPVVEIFGPVIQGEGAMIGRQTSFVRTGGCDFRCTHCDTLHAVLPEEVKKNATRMSPDAIVRAIIDNPDVSHAPWVTLSGGNPAMWDFSEVIDQLHAKGFKVAIETQGSLFKSWILGCDQITISPKGPGMMPDQEEVWDKLMTFMDNLEQAAHGFQNVKDRVCIKVPVFASKMKEDLMFAQRLAEDASTRIFPLYLSLGNYYTPENTREGLTESWLNNQRMGDYRMIADELKNWPALRNAAFLPQLHVLAWGNARSK